MMVSADVIFNPSILTTVNGEFAVQWIDIIEQDPVIRETEDPNEEGGIYITEIPQDPIPHAKLFTCKSVKEVAEFIMGELTLRLIEESDDKQVTDGKDS